MIRRGNIARTRLSWQSEAEPGVKTMAKSSFTISVLFLMLFSSAAPVRSSHRSSNQKQDQPVRIGIDLVTLDISVSDKHRRPVYNLTPKDFTVIEDGALQRIESFSSGSATLARNQQNRSDQKEASATDRQPVARGAGQPFAGYRFISIAIDNTSVEAANRDSVERAVTRYLREQIKPDDFVAIYSIGNSLALVQPFTAERDKLLKAASVAVRGQLATDAATTREEAANEMERAARSIGTGSPIEQADRASRSVFDSYNDVSDYFQAQSLFRSLHAIIDVQRNLTGSKALILFSQGVTLPTSSGYAVDGVVSVANSVGVSVYVIDAGGLSVGEAPRGYDPRGNLGLPTKQRPDIYGGEDPTRVRDGENGLERALKRTLATAQPDRVELLSRLSNQTGGITVTNNNALSAALEMIDSDVRAHYTITYVPRNQEFDGRFREIAVKVTNPEFSVRTRRGYYAVKKEAAITDEATVRKLASDVMAGAEPAFALEMAVSYFLRGEAAYLVPVTIQTPGTAITTRKKGDRYYAELDFVMMVKDSAGAVISTFGRAYPLDLSDEQNRQLSETPLPIRHNVRLAPGTYVITTALRDRASGHTSIGRRGITLPASSDGPRLSSIILAQQTEQLAADYPAVQLARDVLAFGQNRIVMPTDSRFTAAQTLLLFFRVYPPAGSAEHPSLIVAAGFIKDGKVVQRTPTVRITQTPASPDSGFPMATPLKLTNLEPGEYTVRVELIDEATKRRETKEARFTLTKEAHL
jgi:VWFA-related protein